MQTEFKRNYKPEEEAKRKELFAKTRERVNKHNAEAAKGVHSYTLGINHFSDLVSFRAPFRTLVTSDLSEQHPLLIEDIRYTLLFHSLSRRPRRS